MSQSNELTESLKRYFKFVYNKENLYVIGYDYYDLKNLLDKNQFTPFSNSATGDPHFLFIVFRFKSELEEDIRLLSHLFKIFPITYEEDISLKKKFERIEWELLLTKKEAQDIWNKFEEYKNKYTSLNQLSPIKDNRKYLERLIETGHTKKPSSDLLIDEAKFCYALGTYIFRKREKLKFRFLIIDNNPNNFKDKIEKIKKSFGFEFFICSQPQDFKRIIETDNLKEKKFHFNSLEDTTEKKKISDFDFILLDLHLGKDNDGKDIYGDEILEKLYTELPEIPVFILSIVDDPFVIQRFVLKGADKYIPKERLLSLPYEVYEFFESIGPIVLKIKDEKLRRNLIGNLRKWHFNKELLWFGDKCYHMIGHTYEHAKNNWELLNSIMLGLIEKGIIKVDKDGGSLKISSNDLYSLCMATWLHDIGHKGNERYGTAHEIRDNHGIISGEFILKYPKLLGIESEEIDDYKNIQFPFGPQKKPVIQVIKEKVEKRKKITNLEKIALISICHKSNSPLSKEDYQTLITKGKYIPIDFFEGSDREKDEITLEDVLNFLEDEDKERKKLFKLAAIFRLVDSIDINRNRVGSEEERGLKIKVIEQDKKYQLYLLEKEIKSIIQEIEGEASSLISLALMKTFFQDVKERIEKGEAVSQLELTQIAPEIVKKLENYFLLTSYASFISVQPGHFDLHSAIERVDVKVKKKENKISLCVSFISSKDIEELKKEKVVRDPGEKKGKSIRDRLIGTKQEGFKDGYVVKEFESTRHILGDLMELESVELKPRGSSTQELRDEDKPFKIIFNADEEKWEGVSS